MKTFVIHGVYDSYTLRTLKSMGLRDFAFDLRARSLNFIPLRDLNLILSELSQTDRTFLTFENDRIETIFSILDILKNNPRSFDLIFRDNRPLTFYRELKKDFYWMFLPESDWKNILQLQNLKGVFLPLRYQASYQSLHELWEMIDKKGLEVYLHSDNFEQGLFTSLTNDVKFSLDLTAEVETHYRSVDQVKLKSMKIWSKLNEGIAGQR